MSKQQRIEGLDLARALAVFGMVLVNFKLVMSADTGAARLISFAGMFEGRAVATFIVLAGVGITLMTRRANEAGSAELIKQSRVNLLIRAVLLIAIGLAYSPIWPADILHFYGFYFLFAAFLFTRSDAALWWSVIAFVLGFLLMLIVLDYETGWDFETLTYLDFWTMEGMVRHLFFNGFHPVFPWAAFLVIGMWLGRQNLFDADTRWRLMIIAGLVWAITELISQGLIFFVQNALPTSQQEDLIVLADTAPLPPMPLYIVAGAGFAVLVINLCVSLVQRFGTRWFKPLIHTGQMSLTLYVLHVLLGMGVLESIGRLENQTIEAAWMATLLFCLFSVVFASFWMRWFGVGPLEKLFRLARVKERPT